MVTVKIYYTNALVVNYVYLEYPDHLIGLFPPAVLMILLVWILKSMLIIVIF